MAVLHLDGRDVRVLDLQLRTIALPVGPHDRRTPVASSRVDRAQLERLEDRIGLSPTQQDPRVALTQRRPQLAEASPRTVARALRLWKQSIVGVVTQAG